MPAVRTQAAERILTAQPGEVVFLGRYIAARATPDCIHVLIEIRSSSDALTGPCAFEPLIAATASAFDLPLSLAAASLSGGPTFFVSTAWQFRQPYLSARAAPAGDFVVCAFVVPTATSAAAITTIIGTDFIIELLR